jgi:hypothetical protein
MTRRERLDDLTRKAKESNLLIERTSLALGKIYAQVTSGAPPLYKLRFSTFEAWLDEVGDHRASQAYLLREQYLQLKDFLPDHVIERMPLNNARDFLKLPESKRTEAVAEKACEQTNRKFRTTLNQIQPGLALEDKTYKGFVMDANVRPVIEQAITLAKERHGLTTDADALEYICAQFIAREDYEARVQQETGVTVQ